jgi:hypothetical protein
VRSTKSAASRNAGIGVCELCEAAIVMLMRCKGQLKPKPSLFTKQEAESSFERSDAEGGSSRQRGYCCMGPATGRLRFQPTRPAPHQAPNERAENTGTESVDTRRLSPFRNEVQDRELSLRQTATPGSEMVNPIRSCLAGNTSLWLGRQ